jgi:hypothetical protein
MRAGTTAAALPIMSPRLVLLAFLFVAPACKPTERVEGRKVPIGMRSPLDRPSLGVIPGPRPGGGSGGIFNAAGREAEGGTDAMKIGHPPPTNKHWSMRAGNATGVTDPKVGRSNDDINVQQMTRAARTRQ